MEALGAPRGRIVVHPTGIDVRHFAFRAPTPPADGEPLRLVSVARLREKKGVSYAIEAVGRLRATGVPVCYEIAGDGPLRASLEQQVAAAGLGDTVRLRGALPQAEVRALMERSHLLLAPSVVASDGDEEGVPSVIKEALAVGLPVVATRHSGIPEIVIPGRRGCWRRSGMQRRSRRPSVSCWPCGTSGVPTPPAGVRSWSASTTSSA
jgi:colanic acid/amylovoran biosynthesis glycosyltransferase